MFSLLRIILEIITDRKQYIHMKKLFSSMLVAFVTAAAILAGDESAYFPSLHKIPSMPVVAGLFAASPDTSAEPLKSLDTALRSEFSLNWAERYLDSLSKKALVHLFQEKLMSLLPVKSALYSEPRLQDGLYAVTAYLPDAGEALDFLIDMDTLKITFISTRP